VLAGERDGRVIDNASPDVFENPVLATVPSMELIGAERDRDKAPLPNSRAPFAAPVTSLRAPGPRAPCPQQHRRLKCVDEPPPTTPFSQRRLSSVLSPRARDPLGWEASERTLGSRQVAARPTADDA